MALTDKEKAAYGLLGSAALYGAGKYGKRAVARGIDTYGFGNVQGAYAGESKIAQFTNNLLTAGKGKRRNMPIEFMKSLLKQGNPVEINAMKTSLRVVEEYMSKLKSQQLRVPKKVKEYYLNLKAMEPERKMAQAVLQKSFNQPVGFRHGGEFIPRSFPQADTDISKALKNKGFNVNKPFTSFDITNDKFMIKKLRAAATGDPRVQAITKALKENRIKDAKKIAKKGLVKYKGNMVKSGKPLKLVKEGNGYVLKLVPHFTKRGGKLSPTREYVLGGHTQKIHYKPFAGHKGFHKATTDVFDITSYASAGEKGQNIIQKARIGLAGETGRKLGIHQPIVTTGTYKHRAPGGGRTKGSADKLVRKARKFVEASAKTYVKPTKSIPWKNIVKFILTKGRRW
tara:strand:- start:48 stop:1241 length:1194 start_codon:yes stop_codon:yes gene_type:complete